MEISSFYPPINLTDGKWMLGVASFEASISVFNITNENNSFSIITPGDWSSRGGEETINKLQKLLKLRSQNDIKLQMEVVRKRENQIKRI